MTILALLRKQDEEELRQKLSSITELVHGVFSFRPDEKLLNHFQTTVFVDTSVSFLSDPIAISPGEHNLDIDIPMSRFNLIQMALVAKAQPQNSTLYIDAISNKESILKENIKTSSRWSQQSLASRLTRDLTSNKIHLRLTNMGPDSITVKSIVLTLRCDFSRSLARDLCAKYKCDKILVNSLEDEKYLSQYFETININRQQTRTFSDKKTSKTIPQVSILTATYNGLNFIKTCAENILKHTDIPFEWLILDDGSTDGTSEYIRANFKTDNIRLIQQSTRIKNFSTANNILAKAAKSKYLLFLNNDCFVADRCIRNMQEAMDNDPSVGMTGAMLFFPGTQIIQHCGVVFINYDEPGPLPGHLFHRQDLDSYKSFVTKPRLFQAVTAACSMIRTDLFWAVGGFDERFIFGYEDIDLCMKCGELGYKILFVPNAIAYHVENGTLERPYTREDSHSMFLVNKAIFQRNWKNKPIVDADIYITNPQYNEYHKQELTGGVVYYPITRGLALDIYRTDHAVTALKENRVPTYVADWQRGEIPHQPFDAVIFQRFNLNPTTRHILDTIRATRPNVPIGYDIDDYIFDKDIAMISNIDPAVAVEAIVYDEFMRLCDFFTTTTSYMANAIMNKYKKPTFVIPNSITEEVISYRAKNQPLDKITIGYAAGSPTHDCDITEVLEAIEYVFRKNKNVVLKIIGPLNLPDDFQRKFSNRIERTSFVPMSQFPEVLATFDINIAPLKFTPFNHAKSPLKYLEAGALSIPTVASATSGYKEVIDHRENGFVCSSTQEWIECLSFLIENESLRHTMGNTAKQHIKNNFTTKVVGQRLKKTIEGMLSGKH